MSGERIFGVVREVLEERASAQQHLLAMQRANLVARGTIVDRPVPIELTPEQVEPTPEPAAPAPVLVPALSQIAAPALAV